MSVRKPTRPKEYETLGPALLGRWALCAALALSANLGTTALWANSSRQQSESGSNAAGAQSKTNAKGRDESKGGGSSTNGEGLSDAERIARLQRTIADNDKLLEELRHKLGDPQGEYAKAEADFAQIDRDVQEKKKELQKLKEDGTADATALEAAIAALEPRRKLSKERFDLAIKARKALQEQIATLEQKVRQDQEALKKLIEPKPAPGSVETQAAPAAPASAAPAGADAAAQGVPSPSSATPAAPTPAPPPAAAAPPPTSVPAGPPGEGAAPARAAPPPSSTGVAPEADKSVAPDPKLIQAREVATKKESEAQEAAREARSVSERIEALRKSIELERSLLGNTRQRADNAQETQRTLDDELQRRWAEGADKAELDDLRRKNAEARERFREARAESRNRTDRLDTLQSELTTLQAEEIAALRDAEEKRVEAEMARKTVERLQNPFTVRNVLRWTTDHGPRILVIVVGMVLVVWTARLLERRITDWIAHHGKGRGTAEDENRARTLVGVFHNAIRIVVLLGGSLMILAEAGVNILPLMGGAAVLGLAAAFGGQNLLRDYFTGFMILLENQYAVNDVVRIGDVAGLVERITLRLTVLRDIDGRVHFVPKGQITTVSNLTHGWSRALFDVGVAYKEDVDRVMELLVELGKELRRDPEFRHMILEQPEMLGVDQLGDSAVVLRFYIKTRPLMQWTVKREMLRRIKNKFDELGIEIPFPHRTLYHRYETNALDRMPGAPAGIHREEVAG